MLQNKQIKGGDMSIITPSELEDFKASLQNYGYTEDDFALAEIEDPIEAGKIQSITGQVKIKSNKSGIEKTYIAGDQTAWVIEFDNDLRKKVFR
jgi:hypothetical protein